MKIAWNTLKLRRQRVSRRQDIGPATIHSCRRHTMHMIVSVLFAELSCILGNFFILLASLFLFMAPFVLHLLLELGLISTIDAFFVAHSTYFRKLRIIIFFLMLFILGDLRLMSQLADLASANFSALGLFHHLTALISGDGLRTDSLGAHRDIIFIEFVIHSRGS